MSASEQRLSSCLSLMVLCGLGLTHPHGESGPGVPIVVPEGSDVILTCSPTTKLNLEPKLFDWKKDNNVEVFYYDAGIHYNNGRPGQDEHFKGRVSHFTNELRNGNASIKILNTKMADSGVYTCDFPRLQPRETFLIRLVVERNYRDRSGEIPGAPRPSITTLDQIYSWSLLQCEVRAASPKPKVEWQDGARKTFPAEEPQVSEKKGHYHVTLLVNVTKTGHYHCVVEQEEISHRTDAETFVFLSGKQWEDSSSKVVTGWIGGGAVGLFLGALTLAAVQALLVVSKCMTMPRFKGSHQRKDVPPNNSALEPLKREPV